MEMYRELVAELGKMFHGGAVVVDGSPGREAVELRKAGVWGDVVQIWHPSLNTEGTEGPLSGWWLEWGERGTGEASLALPAQTPVWRVAQVAILLWGTL